MLLYHSSIYVYPSKFNFSLSLLYYTIICTIILYIRIRFCLPKNGRYYLPFTEQLLIGNGACRFQLDKSASHELITRTLTMSCMMRGEKYVTMTKTFFVAVRYGEDDFIPHQLTI
jgi:hypothetical protein